jgi:hypothetical protein
MILTEEEKELVQNHRDGFRGVYWHINDFESEAHNNEVLNPEEEIYDRSKFPLALGEMISDHDAEYGITWDNVKHCLDTYCKLNQENEESI